MNRNKLNKGSSYRTVVGLASQRLEILQDSNLDSVKTLWRVFVKHFPPDKGAVNYILAVDQIFSSELNTIGLELILYRNFFSKWMTLSELYYTQKNSRVKRVGVPFLDWANWFLIISYKYIKSKCVGFIYSFTIAKTLSFINFENE